MNPNRKLLDELVERFKYWLHIEDERTIYTIAAVKATHKMPGDPVWLMLIGPSSDGKSEILRAFTAHEDITLEDLTTKSFISGYKSEKTKDAPQFAERISGNTWFIYDFSILLSKRAEERSEILSQLRMIYDGKLSKPFGTKDYISIEIEKNTLIVGSTPEIDATILEDQKLGTRFITYRIQTRDHQAVLDKIMENEDNMQAMRSSLKMQTQHWLENIKIEPYKLTDLDHQNLSILAKQTTNLRTSIDLDKNKEIRNIAYPEAPGRFFKQITQMYRAYRMIGLTEDESLECVRKISVDCIMPVRLRILEYMVCNNSTHTTSQVSMGVGIGKGYTKGQLSSLNALGIIDYREEWDQTMHRNIDKWELIGGNYNTLLNIKPQKSDDHQQQLDEEMINFYPLDPPTEGRCEYCGHVRLREFSDAEGRHLCKQCSK